MLMVHDKRCSNLSHDWMNYDSLIPTPIGTPLTLVATSTYFAIYLPTKVTISSATVPIYWSLVHGKLSKMPFLYD